MGFIEKAPKAAKKDDKKPAEKKEDQKKAKDLEEGIHDRDITSASHTNVKGTMGDYDPKARAASLAKLANFGPKPKEEKPAGKKEEK